jgi:benzodiazapine receptor
MKPSNILPLILCIAIPLALGGIAGVVTTDNISGWYSTINKPSFNPPNSIFGPVWTGLYLLMGIAMFIVWKSSSESIRSNATQIYGVQLILNFAWSFMFFYFHRPDWAFVNIVLLWLAIVYTIFTFYKVRKVAAYLLIPYILWVSFASVLNAAIWKLN